MAPEERFISLNPPTPQDASQRYLAFLQEELAERGKEDALLAVYATQEGSTITLWTFFKGEELLAGGPELESVHDAEVKINAGYFTPVLGQRPFKIEARAILAQDHSLKELEDMFLRGYDSKVLIYRHPKASG